MRLVKMDWDTLNKHHASWQLSQAWKDFKRDNGSSFDNGYMAATLSMLWNFGYITLEEHELLHSLKWSTIGMDELAKHYEVNP